MRFRGYATAGSGCDVDTNRRWIGSSTTFPFGTRMKAPSWRNAVFSAVNGFASKGAVLARYGWTDSGSSRIASARLPTRTPSGTFRTEESLREYRPFTNTSSLPSNFPNTTGSSFSGDRPSPGIRTAGANRVRTIGVTFVYFHISCLMWGNPRSRNVARALRRVSRSHGGSAAKNSFSQRGGAGGEGGRGGPGGGRGGPSPPQRAAGGPPGAPPAPPPSPPLH